MNSKNYIFVLGLAGLEPTTVLLWAKCSTDWTITPKYKKVQVSFLAMQASKASLKSFSVIKLTNKFFINKLVICILKGLTHAHGSNI